MIFGRAVVCPLYAINAVTKFEKEPDLPSCSTLTQTASARAKAIPRCTTQHGGSAPSNWRQSFTLLASFLSAWTRIDFADIFEQTRQINSSPYMSDLDYAEYLRSERRMARSAADLFTRACQTGDIPLFREAVSQNSESVDGWLLSMRKVARQVRAVSPQIQSAFKAVWLESKMLPLRVGDHRALCNAARLLLPKYSGPPVRLFRGAGSNERRRRIYGLSWSADVACATRFADGRRVWTGGSVLLETLAAPKAIICKNHLSETADSKGNKSVQA